MSKKDEHFDSKLRGPIGRVNPLGNDIKDDSSHIEEFNEVVDNQQKKNCRFNIPPIHVIDLIAFWSFLFFFLLFNCIYWVHYLAEEENNAV